MLSAPSLFGGVIGRERAISVAPKIQLLLQAVGLLADMMNVNDFNVSALRRSPIRVVPVEEIVFGMEVVLGEGLCIGLEVLAWGRIARLPIRPVRARGHVVGRVWRYRLWELGDLTYGSQLPPR